MCNACACVYIQPNSRKLRHRSCFFFFFLTACMHIMGVCVCAYRSMHVNHAHCQNNGNLPQPNLPAITTSKAKHNSFVPTSKTPFPPTHTIRYNSCTASWRQSVCGWQIYTTLCKSSPGEIYCRKNMGNILLLGQASLSPNSDLTVKKSSSSTLTYKTQDWEHVLIYLS